MEIEKEMAVGQLQLEMEQGEITFDAIPHNSQKSSSNTEVVGTETCGLFWQTFSKNITGGRGTPHIKLTTFPFGIGLNNFGQRQFWIL